MEREPCSLLRLCPMCPTADTLARILRSTYSITEPIIMNAGSSSKQIKALMETLTASTLPGGTTIAPHLSLIFFGCLGGDYVTDRSAYIEMLRSRWKAENCALKTAALLTHDRHRALSYAQERNLPYRRTFSGVKANLRALRQEGLTFWLLEETRPTLVSSVGGSVQFGTFELLTTSLNWQYLVLPEIGAIFSESHQRGEWVVFGNEW